MLKKRLSGLKLELDTFTVKEKKFIFFAMACVFCISLEYAITRPASASLFLYYYGAKSFPYVWLATVPVNFVAVALYNHFLPRLGCIKAWMYISIVTIVVNTLSFAFVDNIPFCSFFQFLWKDIYILLMYKQIWSLIHASVSQKRAKYLYGIIFSMGGLAAALGGIIPGFLANKIGSKELFLFTLPIYLILLKFYINAYKNSGFSFSLKKEESLFPGFKNSKYILSTLLLVVFMQISISIIEYRYNLTLEKRIPDIDLRTEFTGKIFTIIHLIMMLAQLVGGIVFINLFGLKKLHYMIPFSLLVNTLLYIFVPSLAMASYLYIYIKSLDFSIFAIIREMLYLPMKTEEKFKAKSLIDVFAYRTAKAFSAFFIIFFEVLRNHLLLSLTSILIFILWIVLVNRMFNKDRSYDYVT